MIVIIDYGMVNLGSTLNVIERIGGVFAKVSSDCKDIELAKKLILPGVDSFDIGMQRFRATGLIDLLDEKVLKTKTPTLDICLGMHLFTKFSEEGEQPSLGWIDAESIEFLFDQKKTGLKIPHMDWNIISIQREGTLFKDMYPNVRFYFVHSCHMAIHEPKYVFTTTEYGNDFISVIQHENIIGTQFHLEKSHNVGMKLYKDNVEFA